MCYIYTHTHFTMPQKIISTQVLVQFVPRKRPVQLGIGQQRGQLHSIRSSRDSIISSMMSPGKVIPSVGFALAVIFLGARANGFQGGILYPKESESRELKILDGIWNFRVSDTWDQGAGFEQAWYQKRLEETGPVDAMPVPSSYNDITQDKGIRDYIGWAWYDREFFVPQRWAEESRRVFLRFGSVNYNALVWVNGVPATNHSGGHLPFHAEVTRLLNYNKENRITVAVNNTLTRSTIPQGSTMAQFGNPNYPNGYYVQSYPFDFFNYAGIHRSVHLYTTPSTYIDDITVTTNIEGSTGVINYNVEYVAASGSPQPSCYVEIYDKNRRRVARSKGCSGSIKISNCQLWWPYLMDPNPGYMYTLQVNLTTGSSDSDIYRQNVGIRTVSWSNTTFFINGRPFYFRGFGRHEDSNLRGRGFDPVLNVKDHNLLKWIGANSYRTSHYPYSEELMDQADEQGIVIIDECPAVSLQSFEQSLLVTHKRMMAELVRRDKNRPSVVMWSVANEPQSQKSEAKDYFRELISFTKSLDATRPVTAVIAQSVTSDKAAISADIICVNRYYSWYSDTGHTELVKQQTLTEFTNWFAKYNKPVMITEYGADTVIGMHMNPPFVWTEDYQVAMMLEYFQAFDELRRQGFFIGEMIWNFADFATAQGTTRVVGNRKGVFTRDRQPKASAHLLQTRYMHLAREIDAFNGPMAESLSYCPAK